MRGDGPRTLAEAEDRIADLRIQIKELSRALEGAIWITHPEIRRLCAALGIPPGQSAVLLVLYRAPGMAMSCPEIAALVPLDLPSTGGRPRNDPDFRDSQTIRSWVQRIRATKGVSYIISTGWGLTLSDEAAREIEKALSP